MIFILIIALLFSGCVSFQPTGIPDQYPQLIKQEPLPAWPFRTAEQEVTLEIKIHIGSDGFVKNAEFLTPSLSREWNTSALAKIREWQFSPAMVGSRPVPLWIRQTIHVRFEDATYLRLAEIVCATQQDADSVFVLLEAGAPFDSLARIYSTATSRLEGGFLGDVDLRTLPRSIRLELQKVRAGHYTRPLLLGRNYIIYNVLPSGPRLKPFS